MTVSKRLAVRLLVGIVLWTSAAAAGAEKAPDPSGPPGKWLPVQGKPEKWVQATARCRELLAKLKLDDPLVKKHLPSIRDKVHMIRRVDGFNWKTVTSVQFLENMLADLAAGAVPNRRYAGKGLGFPYWSETMQRIEAIWLHVPPGYDPGKEYQLFMYYKCGGGIHYRKGKAHGGYRPSVEVANQTDTFHAWSSLHIQVKGRLNAHTELEEAVPAMAREFAISPDRVFLSGWSDGGFTALWLASRHPHLLAGIAPNCANWQYSNVNHVGLSTVPLLVVDGWSDGGYVQKNFARFHVLATMGYPVAGIWGQHGHAYKPYEDVNEFKRILDWAKARRRDPWPRRVRYATWNLYWHRAHWVSIERMADACLAAQIDARLAGPNRVEVKAWNVGAYRLSLSDKLLDAATPVTVLTNGRPSYSGPFKADLLVELVDPPEGKFVKAPATHGGITARMSAGTYGSKEYLKIPGRRWLWVKPTAADEETSKLLAKWYPNYAKADTEVTDKDVAARNLFLYGGPDVNRFTDRIAADLPVKFAPGRFTIGRKVYDQPTACVTFIHPNPLNPRKYVIVLAYNDAAAFVRHGLHKALSKSFGAWGFRSGDCVVAGVPAGPRKWGCEVAAAAFRTEHHVFDVNWRPAQRGAVGELAGRFDYTQILRLRADAMREAAGADAAVIMGYTPSWRRWRTDLPAGAVSLHDLATVDMLPEYVTVAEMTGAGLYQADRRGRAGGLLTRASASTVLADQRHPAYDPKTSLLLSQIDPKKTYRVAMGYAGLPTYGANPAKMPALHFFNSPDEFARSEHVSLAARNMRQLPLELTEAVARYIRKRGKVSPRPVCFDLTQYLMNPEANEYGSLDWLHVGAEVAWPRPGEAGPLKYRYTMNLGLRAADDPDPAPPRKGSKKFLDTDLAAGGPIRFDFASLAKKLPVTVNAAAERFAILAGEDGKSFRLSGPEAGGAVGRAVLVNLRLANAGDKAVTGLAALSTPAMRPISTSAWPGRPAQGAPQPFYYGYRTATGPRRKPPVHEDAALFLFAGAPPALGRAVERNVGYNFGLVALHRVVSVKAGEAAALPLLFVAVDDPPGGPDVSLAAVLEALKDELMNKLTPPPGKASGK